MRTLPTLFRDWTDEPVHVSDLLDRVLDRTLTNFDSGTFAPRMDVSETDKQFEVTVELPGVNKDDIDISMQNNVLTVSGERKHEHTEKKKNYYRIESSYGQFSRSLPFPDIINPDKVKARYDNGLLHITIPKVKERANKKIKVS